MRINKFKFYILTMILVITTMFVVFPKKIQASSGSFRVHFIDVGSGDGALIEVTDADGTKHYGMIDTGLNDSKASNYITKNMQKEIFQEEQKEIKKYHLEFILLSHAHGDHMGGMKSLLEMVKANELQIDKIYSPYTMGDIDKLDIIYDTQTDSETQDPTKAYDVKFAKEIYGILDQLDLDEEHGVYQKLVAGNQFSMGNDSQKLNVNILGPAEDTTYTYGKNVNLAMRQINKTSIVCKMTYGSRSFLMTGDSQKETDEQIVANGYSFKADVLKVPHHGMKDVPDAQKIGDYTSNHNFLISRAKAAIAVVSNQKNEVSSKVVRDLQNAGTATYETKSQGTIIVDTNGTSLSVSPEKKGTSVYHASYNKSLKGSGLVSNIKMTSTGTNTFTATSINDDNTYKKYEKQAVTLKFSGQAVSYTSITSIAYKLVPYGVSNSKVSWTTGKKVKVKNGFKGRVYVRYCTPLGYTDVKFPGFTVDTKAPTNAKITGSKSGIKTLTYGSNKKAYKTYKNKIKLKFSASYGTSGKKKIQYKIVPKGKSPKNYKYKTGNSLTYKKKHKTVRVFVRFYDKSGNKVVRKTNQFRII